MGSLQYHPIRLSEDAQGFLERMEDIDDKIAYALNTLHAQQMKKYNQRHKDRERFNIGTKVWVQRPKELGGRKLRLWWEGPYRIVEQTGMRSYKVEISPGRVKDFGLAQLKRYEADQVYGIARPLFYKKGDSGYAQKQRQVEYIRDCQLNHRGEPEWLTHWANTQPSEDTWEPAATFLTGCSQPWVDYCRANNLEVGLLASLEEEREVEGEDI